MTLNTELKELAKEVLGLRFTVPKSRNRHREVDNAFELISEDMNDIANCTGALQDACDTNMTLFESLIDLYERGHISINPDSPDNIKDFAKDLFGNMRSLIATYEAAKEASTSDSTAG